MKVAAEHKNLAFRMALFQLGVMNTSKADLNKSPDKRANIALRLFGPGLVTGPADDDPSGIATYSQAGAQFGYVWGEQKRIITGADLLGRLLRGIVAHDTNQN
jgi:hypothetical protein